MANSLKWFSRPYAHDEETEYYRDVDIISSSLFILRVH